MRITKTLPIAAAALLALPGTALAKDRNHDGIPDGWEKAHNLSLRVNQAHRDQDHDGLNNLSEFRHGTNPHRANTRFVGRASQDNGNAGTVTSFANGVLTITLADGSTLTGSVSPQTDVTCDGAQGQSQAGDDDQNETQGGSQGGDRARIASDGQDSQGQDNSQGDSNGQGDDNEADDNQGAQPSSCAIAQGDPVRQADLQATSAGAVFKEVELAK